MTAIFANYGRTHATTPENTVTQTAGHSVFRSINHGPSDLTFTLEGRKTAEIFMIGEVKRWTAAQRPAFLHVFLANWSAEIPKGIRIRIEPMPWPRWCNGITVRYFHWMSR
jgi:hypothetical protein